MAEEKRKRKRLRPTHRWTEEESDKLLQSVINQIKFTPERFEKPTTRQFYEKMFRLSNDPTMLIISQLGWKLVKDKIRNLKQSFMIVEDWMSKTGAGLIEEGKEQEARDYIIKRCPHYDKLKQLFGEHGILQQIQNVTDESATETGNFNENYDNMKVGLNDCEDDEEEEIKCGEFFLYKGYSGWRLKCLFCFVSYNELSEFIKHVQLCHIGNENSTNNSSQLIKIKSKNTTKRRVRNRNTNKSRKRRNKNANRPYSDITCDICERDLFIDEGIQKHRLYYHDFKDPFLSNANSPLENEKIIPCSENETRRNDPCQCTFCPYRSNSAGARVLHERTHTGERPYECEICKKRFYRQRTMLMHQKSHNNVNQTRFCDICRFPAATTQELSEHMSVHSEDEQIKCRYCSKKFLRKRNRDIHERNHSGERPYQCSDCGKTFIRRGDLTVHARQHTGIKPYKCMYCEKSYYTNMLLKNHIVVHTGERPFSCKICGKTFLRKKNVAVHIKIHSEVRGYVCSICGKSYKHHAGLYAHKKTHDTIVNVENEIPQNQDDNLRMDQTIVDQKPINTTLIDDTAGADLKFNWPLWPNKHWPTNQVPDHSYGQSTSYDMNP